MYTTHFGLREMPFSITPDPAYLYMSPRHQEALGHLLYGTGQYGGFVQLTGEVGTGKTTIIRTLLAQKLDHVDAAVILNPRQSETEFVASICDELGVKYPKKGTLKSRVDALNEYLLKAHSEGRRTVVIIDEAQNLQPEVLEQVRLLTNLETHKEKLLRIMLVGQPELSALLARPDLRQLAQRITARYHLTPLEPHETGEYIKHRLVVAGGSPDLFAPRSITAIHRHSRGVPRLVNVVCDRALLGAYSMGAKQVAPEMVERAAQEVGGETRVIKHKFSVLDAAIVAAILAVGAWWFWHSQTSAPPAASAAADATPATVASAAAPPATGTATPVVASASSAGPSAASAPPGTAAPGSSAAGPATSPAAGAAGVTLPQPAVTVDALLRTTQPLPLVLSRLVEIWNAHPQVQPGENVCKALMRERLGCFKGLGDWKELRQLNRPAILTLSSGRAGTQYVLLRELGAEDAVLETSAGPMRIGLDQIGLLWSGEFLMLWKRETSELWIGPQAKPDSVIWLRERLADVEGKPLKAPLSGSWDDDLRQQLLKFQAAQGLDQDGLAGARTLIVLANLKPQPGTPNLEPTHVAHP